MCATSSPVTGRMPWPCATWPPGAWRNFHGSIEGFSHTPGVRNVLRIDRYQRKQAPADASRYVYVLDLVVESETVAK